MNPFVPSSASADPSNLTELVPIANPNFSTWRSRHWAGLSVVALTLFAAAIRFFHLSSPCLWYDEARVYYRVCGTYDQLLGCLRADGFGPLHYEIDWVMVRSLALPAMIVKWQWLVGVFPSLKNAHPGVHYPGPAMLRFIPSLSGTLMVPAIYFLGRQLLPAKTSLLAAAFTACSGFLIFYSRDAKMYMDTWLFVTLGMGSLLWWFRTERCTAWLCWIACSAAASGIHATSLIAVGLSLVFLFTQKTLRWQKAVLWLVGVVLITAGPIGYYEKFNTWKDRVSEDWHNSELQWIKIYNYGRTGQQLSRYLASSMLIGWEWPRESAVPFIQPMRVNVPVAIVTTLAVILVLAVFPWPRRLRGTFEFEPPRQARWRVLLWLSLWIVLPAYCFYCRSMPNFASPLDWGRTLLNLLPGGQPYWCEHRWPGALLCTVLVAGMLAAASRGPSRLLLIRGIELLAVFMFVLGACWGIYAVCAPVARAAATAGKPWESLWVPRYLGVIWPALALTIAALLMRLPTLPVRIGAIALLLGVNLFYGGARIFGQTEPPVDLMAADAFAAENPANHTVAWTNLPEGEFAPGTGNLFSMPGEYYYQAFKRTSMSPVLFRSLPPKRYKQMSSWLPLPSDRYLPRDVQHLVVWNQYRPTEPASRFERNLFGWQLRSDTNYTVHDFWTWQDVARFRRREYVRLPATQPVNSNAIGNH